MARAKKTETKKTTTKKTAKKSTKNVVEEFPVDDIINDLKGTLIKLTKKLKHLKMNCLRKV